MGQGQRENLGAMQIERHESLVLRNVFTMYFSLFAVMATGCIRSKYRHSVGLDSQNKVRGK